MTTGANGNWRPGEVRTEAPLVPEWLSAPSATGDGVPAGTTDELTTLVHRTHFLPGHRAPPRCPSVAKALPMYLDQSVTHVPGQYAMNVSPDGCRLTAPGNPVMEMFPNDRPNRLFGATMPTPEEALSKALGVLGRWSKRDRVPW